MEADNMEDTQKDYRDQDIIRECMRYKSVIQDAVDIIFSIDSRGNFIDANAAFLHEGGWDNEDIIGKRFDFMVHQDDLPTALDAFQRGCKGEICEFELRALRKDGSYGWFSFINRPVCSEDGDVVGIDGIARNITDRKTMEEQLRRSEEQLRSLRDNIPLGIFQSTSDGKIGSVNPALVCMFGYDSEAEMLDISATDLYAYTEDRETLVSRLAEDGIVSSFEVELKRKDETRFWGELHIRAVRDEESEILHHDGIVQDITERKHAESALRESETRYRTLIEQSLQGIVIVQGFSPELIFANTSAASIVGYTVSDLMTMSPEEIARLIYEEDRDLFFGNYMKRLEGAEVPSRYEFRAIRKDGSVRWIEIFAKRIEYKGKPAVQAAYVDITGRKYLQEEIIRRQRIDSSGLLAGGIAHDFNNMLTGIIGHLSLAKEFASVQGNTKIVERLDEVEMVASRAKNLTRRLMIFAKGDTPDKRVAAIDPLVRDAAAVGLSGSNARCRFDVASDVWDVEVDEDQISQVIHNLVVNANQAMDSEGEILISIQNTTAEDENRVVLQTNRFVKISVTDSGAGIPPEEVPRIFDPYFTTKERGSGLGLAIVYSVVKGHGGEVFVDSIPGRGTTFDVLIPAADRE